MRKNARLADQLRHLKIESWEHSCAEGSVLISFGNTRVVCTASMEDIVPPFLRGKGTGWLTAEYGMMPMSSKVRIPRDVVKGKPNGRTTEIQRIIGRSLRTCVDLGALGERSITIDCDVIMADGGTRVAAISGGYVALAQLLKKRKLEKLIKFQIAAISLGIVKDELLLDLDYEEDSSCDSDMNLIFNDKYEIIECLMSSERSPISQENMMKAVSMAAVGVEEIFHKQKILLGKNEH